MMNNLSCGRLRWLLFLCFSIAILPLSGCGGGSDGPARHPVKGKVTFEGEAVQEGTVSFRNVEYAGGGSLDPTGAFEIEEGLPEGTYKVYISPPDIQTAPTFGQSGSDSPEAKEVSNIPQKYRLAATTDLEETVKSGDNVFTLEMKAD